MCGRLAYRTALLVIVIWASIASPEALAQLPGSLIVTITSPASGSTVSGMVTVSVSVSIVGSLTVAGVQFKLDGANLGAEDTSPPYSVPWNTTTASNGTHTLTAVARDILGVLWTSDPVTVTVFNDTTTPTVTITAPAAGATVSGTIPVTATASDNVGGGGVQFLLDGAPLGTEDTTAPYAVSWDTTAASNSSHTLTAVARDAAGNRATSAGVVVTVSNGSTTVTRYEENNPAISYSPAGAWVQRGPEVAVFSGSYAVSSDVTGATATLTFTGTAVSWIGLKCNVCGIASVSIDGGTATSVDTAGVAAPGSSGLTSEVVFTASGLAAGSHTMVITVTGTTTSGGAHIVVDAFDVTGAGGAPPPTTTRIEETDPAINYTGNWYPLSDPKVSGGTYREANEAGARATLSFTGTAVNWIGAFAPTTGIARIYVDGTLMGTVDTYAPSVEAQAVMFTASGLARGPHTLTIEATGTQNPASGGAWVVVDAFDVTS